MLFNVGLKFEIIYNYLILGILIYIFYIFLKSLIEIVSSSFITNVIFIDLNSILYIVYFILV